MIFFVSLPDYKELQTMRERSRKILFALALICMMAVAGCSGIEKLKDIQVTDYSISSLSPKGLRSLKASLDVTVDNPGVQFSLNDISGQLFYKGEPLADYVSEDVTVKGKTKDGYTLPLTLTLSEGASLMKLYKALSEGAEEDFTARFRAKAKLKGGLAKVLEYDNLSLKDLSKGGLLSK